MRWEAGGVLRSHATHATRYIGVFPLLRLYRLLGRLTAPVWLRARNHVRAKCSDVQPESVTENVRMTGKGVSETPLRNALAKRMSQPVTDKGLLWLNKARSLNKARHS